MNMRHLRNRYLLQVVPALIALTLLLPSAAVAQVDTGTIQGTVRDSTGGVVPAAVVTLVNVDMGVSFQTKTNDVGNYQFPSIRIGNYTVVAEATGFAPVTREGISLSIQQRYVADFLLKPSNLAETVSVTAEAVQLQTQESSLGATVESKTINNLPLNGRNYTFLAQLSPGVVQAVQDGRGFAASGSFSANGQDSFSNNYLLDGVDNNSNVSDFMNGTTYVYRPSVDALQEFRVQTSSYSAEFGRAGGAILNASIKSGTERYRGNVFQFHRNAMFDANNFFNEFQGQEKGKFIRNQFGGTLGGPLRFLHRGDKRTFFFADYEGTTQRQAQLFQVNTPTALMQQSNFTNFSELLTQGGTRTDRLGRVFPLGTIMDPATTRLIPAGMIDPMTGIRVTGTGNAWIRDPIDPSGNNVIPANRIDNNARNLLKAFPLPTRAGLNQNFVANPIERYNNHQGDLRIDQYLSQNDTVFFRFSTAKNDNVLAPLYPGVIDGSLWGGSPTTIRTHGEAVNWTRVWSSTTVSEVRFGFTGLDMERGRAYGDDFSVPGQFGLPVYDAPGYGGLPYFLITGIGQFGPPEWNPATTTLSTPQFSAVTSKLHGAHSLKLGFQYMQPGTTFYQPRSPAGGYEYFGQFTDVPNTTGGNTGMAQMLLTPIKNPFVTQIANVCGPGVAAPCRADFVGGPNAINNTKDPSPAPEAVWSIWSGFFDDSWKVTPKLTVNLGLRYDFVRNSDAPGGRGANFLMEPTPTYVLAKDSCNTPLSKLFLDQLASNGIALGCHSSNNLIKSPKNMLAPRVGVAYNFDDRWVVRAGGGIFYQTSVRSNVLGNLRQYPFEYSVRLTNLSPGEPIIYADGSTATFESGINPIGIQDATTFNPRNMGLSGTPSPLKLPYSIQYNVTVQHQLTPSQTVSIGYVGSQSRDGALTYDYNSARVLAPPGLSAATFRQFPDFASASETVAGAKGSYDALQLTYDKRMADGFTTKVNYTFQKCLSEARQPLTGGDVGGQRNLFVLGPDMARCNTDAPHLLAISGTYGVPLGRGERFLGNASGVLNQMISGWRVNVIAIAQSGNPITIGCPVATSTGSGCNAILTGEPLYPENRTFMNWLNPAAFANPPAATMLDQSDLSPLGGDPTQARGPDYRRVDLSVFKEFPASEGHRFEFRVEIFNLTNRPNFSSPGFSAGTAGLQPPPGVRDFTNTANFGRITSLRNGQNDQRQIQLALKYYF
jgi:hypothetical protein